MSRVQVQRRAIHIPERRSSAVKDLEWGDVPASASTPRQKMLSREGKPTHNGTEPETTDLFPVAPALPAVIERQKLFCLLVDLRFLEPTLTARKSSRHAGESCCKQRKCQQKGSSTPECGSDAPCERSRSRLLPLIIPDCKVMSKVCCQATVRRSVMSRSPFEKEWATSQHPPRTYKS